MLSRWPIRRKLQLGIAALALIVVILSFSGIRGVYSYRQLARAMSRRVEELPLAAELATRVSDLQVAISPPNAPDFPAPNSTTTASYAVSREEFSFHFHRVQEALRAYKDQLALGKLESTKLDNFQEEEHAIAAIERKLAEIDTINQNHSWVLETDAASSVLQEPLADMRMLANDLPNHLQNRMYSFASEVRGEYRTLIILAWTTSVLALIILGVLFHFFYRSIFQPLRLLVRGSRRVAGGDFDHRIELSTQDEVAELAAAMNAMTTRFQEIRDDLDSKVQLRTKEVIRSEKLASVGFLAAGVAHEINNPLNTVAWAAESLHSRLGDVLEWEDSELEDPQSDIHIIHRYLKHIQDESFRCKGITESLLDFSRMGDVERQDTNLTEIVSGVVDMIQRLGKYRNKSITWEPQQVVIAPVNQQEIKQVVLNLITNSLDSLDVGGQVDVTLERHGDQVELVVTDNGCGMEANVLQHLFEPFFTRKKGGTGLGLSITHQIITDHGGRIEPFSAGPGCGSQFRVILPLSDHETQEIQESRTATAA